MKRLKEAHRRNCPAIGAPSRELEPSAGLCPQPHEPRPGTNGLESEQIGDVVNERTEGGCMQEARSRVAYPPAGRADGKRSARHHVKAGIAAERQRLGNGRSRSPQSARHDRRRPAASCDTHVALPDCRRVATHPEIRATPSNHQRKLKSTRALFPVQAHAETRFAHGPDPPPAALRHRGERERPCAGRKQGGPSASRQSGHVRQA